MELVKSLIQTPLLFKVCIRQFVTTNEKITKYLGSLDAYFILHKNVVSM